MALRINIEITTESGDYTTREQAIIQAMQAHPSNGTSTVVNVVKAQEPAEEAPAEPAKKPAARKPRGASSTRAAVLEDTPEPETEEVPGDPQEDTTAETEEQPTLEQAVQAAQKLMGAGKVAKVKEALAAVGAEKVSAVAKPQLGEFLALLNEAA